MGSKWIKWLLFWLSLSGTSVEKPAHWLNAPSCPELNVLTQLEQSLLYVRQIAPVRQDLAVERENPMVRGREILNLILEWSWMYFEVILHHLEAYWTVLHLPEACFLEVKQHGLRDSKTSGGDPIFSTQENAKRFRLSSSNIYCIPNIFNNIQSISNYNYLQSKNDLDRIDLTVV